MSYITREDGPRFVIPSYRDVLSVKKSTLLKKEIRLLASSYGDYIALQKKGLSQYDVAFSPEPGLLLGETVWSYFKRPRDLVYCEEIPNTNNAILVIVKSGSVYLDGSFPLDSIPDELIVFQTQTNNFEIYVHGNVPISQTHEDGKFSFDPSSVKSFTILENAAFPRLHMVPQFELQLVDVTLAKQGIGVFPIKNLVLAAGLVLLVWGGWSYLSATHEEVLPSVFVKISNPYQPYVSALTSPSPSLELQHLARAIPGLYAIPGWEPMTIDYANQALSVSVKSLGARTNTLFAWAKRHKSKVLIKTDGFYLTSMLYNLNRGAVRNIYKLESVIATLIDRLSYVLPGNSLTLDKSVDYEVYFTQNININFHDITPVTLGLIAQQFKNLPLNLSKVSMTINDQGLTGTIEITVLGN